jgi:hypothetical protein
MKIKTIIQILNGGCLIVFSTAVLLFGAFFTGKMQAQEAAQPTQSQGTLNTEGLNMQGPTHPSQIQIAHFVFTKQITDAIQTISDKESATGFSSPAWLDNFESQYYDEIHYRKATISKILRVFNDPHTRDMAKCYAASYLGMLHASDAADSLATNITIIVPMDSHHMDGSPCGSFEPMSAALVAIGTSSIPAMIRNLEESDDVKIRKPSLNVLVQIEGDKDVVQLRLQKALDAQSDATKKARLQLALKTLAEVSSNK